MGGITALAVGGGRGLNSRMKPYLMLGFSAVLFCQCESVSTPSSGGRSLTDSGLSPAERVRDQKNRPVSDDPSDPMHKVHAKDGTVGIKVLEF
ncbi:MAG: hypothetical protein JWL81_903 [Verrucomicrobiales bacterium]|nr:hypothetical protein [Verrucomicrobiales bacterium]